MIASPVLSHRLSKCALPFSTRRSWQSYTYIPIRQKSWINDGSHCSWHRRWSNRQRSNMWPLGCRESCETGGTRWMSEDGVRRSTHDSECNCIHMVNITSWSHNIVGGSQVCSISATTTTQIFNAT